MTAALQQSEFSGLVVLIHFMTEIGHHLQTPEVSAQFSDFIEVKARDVQLCGCTRHYSREDIAFQ